MVKGDRIVKHAKVVGWRAVEKMAEQWEPTAAVTEVEPQLWHVFANGLPIGVIGKEPWTENEIERRAIALFETNRDPGDEA
jgi:hypothetical protein